MSNIENNRQFANTIRKQETQNWINQLSENFDTESVASSSIVESSLDSFSEDCETDSETNSSFGKTIKTHLLGDQTDLCHEEETYLNLRELLKSINSIQTVGNVNIENSTGVHVGNITNINGNVQIIHACPKKPAKRIRKVNKIEESDECVPQDAFLRKPQFRIPEALLSIIPRCSWLAQKPMEEYEFLEEPVELVIISHTATESSEKQAKNICIIRDIQCFHIESREWNDIAYNFLIGCDGNVYEGRGWGVVGAHTKGYNSIAIGVSFIGTFMRELPSKAALNAFKALMNNGVSEGHLSEKYKVIGHCQCRPTESPGRRLFDEVQKWEHFYDMRED